MGRHQHHLLDRSLPFVSAGFESQRGHGRDRRCVATRSGIGACGGVDGNVINMWALRFFRVGKFWKTDYYPFSLWPLPVFYPSQYSSSFTACATRPSTEAVRVGQKCADTVSRSWGMRGGFWPVLSRMLTASVWVRRTERDKRGQGLG